MAEIIQVIFGQETPIMTRPEGSSAEELQAQLRNGYLTSWLEVQNCVERANGDIAIYTAVKLYRAVFSSRFWFMVLRDVVRRLKHALTIGGMS